MVCPGINKDTDKRGKLLGFRPVLVASFDSLAMIVECVFEIGDCSILE